MTSWGRNLVHLQTFSMENCMEFFKKKGWTRRQRTKGKKFFIEQYVHNVRTNNNFEVSACCYKSQKKNDKPHSLCMIFELCSSGSIELKQAHCTCEAGNSESCSHVVALAYMLENYTILKYSEVPVLEDSSSCTQKPMAWNKPRGPKIEPAPVADLIFAKPLTEVRKKTPIKRTLAETLLPPSNEDIVELKNKVQRISEKIPLSYLLCNDVDDTLLEVEGGLLIAPENSMLGYQHVEKQNVATLPIMLPLFDMEIANILLSMPPVDSARFANFTFERSNAIEISTRDQNSNINWHEERKGRFTASNFHKIIRRKNLTQAFLDSLANDISHVPQIRHGTVCEAEALREYTNYYKNIKYFKCGLVIHPYAPHLGASPDGIIYDPACGYGVLEIKCPSGKKYNTLEGACAVKQFYLTLDENKACSLKTNHAYYAQVQGQMLLTGLRWCDFLVYLKSSNEMHVERIALDPAYCMNMYVCLTDSFNKLSENVT